MSRQGWVKFLREWLEHPVINKDTDYLAVWVYLVAAAAYEPTAALFGGKSIMLRPGQLTTGRAQLASETSTQQDKAWRIIKALEDAQLITRQSSSKNSLITVLSWDSIQGNAQQNAQQMHNKCTTNAQQMHTLEERRNKKEEIADIDESIKLSSISAAENIPKKPMSTDLYAEASPYTGTETRGGMGEKEGEPKFDDVVREISKYDRGEEHPTLIAFDLFTEWGPTPPPNWKSIVRERCNYRWY